MVEELRRHLARLAAWSGAWLVVGSAGAALAPGELWRSFFVWNAAWCAVNLIICLASWRGRPSTDRRRFREFLMLNEGLNVGYLGVGVTLGLASPNPAVQGAGWAVALQGVALLALDAWLLRRVPAE